MISKLEKRGERVREGKEWRRRGRGREKKEEEEKKGRGRETSSIVHMYLE